MSAATLLQICDLHAGYGPIKALHGISLEVKRGEIVTIIAATVPEKSTTLRAISSIVKANSGQILFNGHPIQNSAPNQIVRLGLGHSPEGRQVFPQLTVLENLEMGALHATIMRRSKAICNT